MTIHFKPNFFTKLLAFVIVILLISDYSDEQESHRLIVWLIGDSIVSTITQALLFCLAVVLACVTFNFGHQEEISSDES